MNDCPFCDPDVIKAQTILDSTTCFVLYNIRPANKGHCLVIPKRHVTTIKEVTDEELCEVFRLVKKVSETFQDHLHPIGFNYGFNEGRYAGQRVAHLHIHIMPRFEGDKDYLPEHHLFHRHPGIVHNFTSDELQPFIDEFRSLLETYPHHLSTSSSK